ncbi:MAG: AIM24 family protein, partial [Candidatus Bathyarchaeota archaeon]|nr:AIM24 family protein [Candidatus Bathyarchaeota archaeon]
QGETLVVDNFHLAALSTTCKYEVRMFGGLKSTMLGGEGLVTDVTGPGEVYIQTKNPQEFVNWLWRYIGPRVHAASRGHNRGIGFRPR